MSNAQPQHGLFLKHFGVDDIFVDVNLTRITGKYVFKVNIFTAWLRLFYGYNDQSSVNDFVVAQFGDDANKFILSLMNNNSEVDRDNKHEIKS